MNLRRFSFGRQGRSSRVIITMPEGTLPVSHRSSFAQRAERRVAGGRAATELQQDADEIQPLELEPSVEESGTLLSGKSSSSKGTDSYRLVYMCVSGAAFVNAMTFSILGPFLPDYVSTRFRSSSTQVGMIMAAYPAVNLITSPLVSFLLNRYGRVNALLTGLVTLAVATMLYGAAQSVFWLFVASGLHGTSLSLIHISSLALLSAFPDRITEGMAGIEVWSGVALVLGPPLGGLAHPFGGVSSVFMLMATFPLVMLLFAPRMRHLARSSKDDFGELGSKKPASFWKVARSRGVLTGAFVTAYNYGINGFLEATLAPHLALTLSTSPSSIGFVFILPNVLYTVMAAKAEDIVDRVGVKKTLLYGLGIMAVSVLLLGPSPALAPVLMTRAAAKGSIGLGLLAFQVGTALATVPAFTVMQASVAGMGKGGDNMVASAHSLAIGVGEVIGPVLGGMMVELLPQSPAMACEPGPWALDLGDPVPKKQAGSLVIATGANSEKIEAEQAEGKQARSVANREAATATAAPAGTAADNESSRKANSNAVGEIEERALAAANKEARLGARVEGGGAVKREADMHVARGKAGESIELGQAGGVQRDAVREDQSELEQNAADGVDRLLEVDINVIDGAHSKMAGMDGGEEGGRRDKEQGGGDVVGDRQGGAGNGDPAASFCDSAFPLAATLVAWVSLFSVLVAYGMYPSGKDRNGGGRVTNESGMES